MYWNILVWLRIEIPDGFLHQISKNLKIDDLVTGGTINLQLTHIHVICERGLQSDWELKVTILKGFVTKYTFDPCILTSTCAIVHCIKSTMSLIK